MLTPGGKFGDFDVVRELGRGGMGAVYLVHDPATGDEYAAKVMFAGSSEGEETTKRRFIREAEIAMAADSPHLVKVYQVGRDPETGLAYMIMDYVAGGSLHDRITRRLIEKKGPYSVKEALRVIRPLLSALAAAEAKGIVHRDIKPDNILFDANDVPMLADLGIAKVTRERTTELTMSNVVVGTPAYMAPEQLVDSKRVDGRADLYALGIVLWEMLALERPLADADTAQLMARAIRGQRIPDIRTKRRNAPQRIVEFLRRMTDPKPGRRFATADAALRFLDEWRARRRRLAWFAFIAVALTLVSVLVAAVYIVLNWDAREEARIEQSALDEFSIPDGL